MQSALEQRIQYGQSIRERALCLLEAHGQAARMQAIAACEMPGVTEQDRHFWQAVADRIARLCAARDGTAGV